MIIFKEDTALLQKHCERIKEFIKEYPEYEEDFRIPKTLDDVFCPYEKWIRSMTEEERIKYHIIADNELSFEGIYVTNDCNNHYQIEHLTDYEEVDFLYDYGVVDNATQILENIEIPDNAVVLMMPVFKEDQGDYGWRWHKWGPYYGIQNCECEYLANEKGTEMIYTFSVITLKQKEKQND